MNNKILVIEDNEQNQYLVRYILENNNYKVFTAQDGQTGVEMVRIIRPDLILLDIQLPVIDGYTVAKMLRQNPDLQ